MTPEKWMQVKTIFVDAIDLPLAERGNLLDRVCGADLEVRREVESLLSANDALGTGSSARAAIDSAASAITLEHHDTVRRVLAEALGGQYDILRMIGRGGMGAVYLAREKVLERLVAIKVLRPELAASAESRERFRREARIAANLSHPGILQLHTFGEVGGVWFFVMRYVQGESLAEQLERRQKLPWVEAHRILTEVADALACAHSHHVVHRDIKPANILIEEETGRAVLADFGISKMFGAGDSLTESGVAIGTPHYMSPEQTMGLPDVDERSDIYSLGAVGYTMVCGREPFSGDTPVELIYSRLTRDPAPIESINPDVPEALASVIMKCLARERAERWQGAASLKEALSQAGEKADDGLPEGIRDLPSFGPYSFIWAIAWAAFALLTARSPAERALLLLVALLVPVGLVLHLRMVEGQTIGFGQMLRVAARPPDWWGMYWPRSLRRRSDIWPRLPLPARLVRIALSAFFLIVPGAIVVRRWFEFGGKELADSGFFFVETAVVLGTAITIGASLAWIRRRGLSRAETLRLMFGATTPSTGWNTPALSRVLSPAAGPVRIPEAGDAADHRRAIRELLPMLPEGLTDIRTVAAELVDRAVQAIERDRTELSSIEREASPAEADRLRGRLAILGEAAAHETGERAEMRVLLQNQLELVRRMRDRYELSSSQRKRRLELLRELWVVLCASCTDSAGEDESRKVSDKVRALCAQLSESLDQSGSVGNAPFQKN
ncbi:MAG: serine/threonine protein kinase [Gemmatimonadaceae bacterium]|nr:serine/threonine protein kinase [Gemmatimonadaceae bacterium]